MDATGPAVGVQLPPFSVPDDTEQQRTPDNLIGSRGLLLAFVHGTWCAPCVPTYYALAKYAPVYIKEGVAVAVVSGDNPQSLRNFRKTAPAPLPYTLLADADEQVHELYQTGTTRVWLLADAGGVIRMKHLDPDGHNKPSHSMLLDAITTHLSA